MKELKELRELREAKVPLSSYQIPQFPSWYGDGLMAEMVSEEVASLWAALEDVQDPEFPMSIVDMGLVIDVQKLGRTAQVKMTFTAMGCPGMEMIIEDIRGRLLQEPDVDEVDIQVVWSPVWTKHRLTERGQEIMQLYGVTV